MNEAYFGLLMELIVGLGGFAIGILSGISFVIEHPEKFGLRRK